MSGFKPLSTVTAESQRSVSKGAVGPVAAVMWLCRQSRIHHPLAALGFLQKSGILHGGVRESPCFITSLSIYLYILSHSMPPMQKLL